MYYSYCYINSKLCTQISAELSSDINCKIAYSLLCLLMLKLCSHMLPKHSLIYIHILTTHINHTHHTSYTSKYSFYICQSHILTTIIFKISFLYNTLASIVIFFVSCNLNIFKQMLLYVPVSKILQVYMLNYIFTNE